MTAHGATTSSREVILNVAERLMSTDGYDNTSIAAICRDSDLPVGSIYHHFGSKSGVLAAVMDRWSNRFFAELPMYAAGDATPEARMRSYWTSAEDGIEAEHAVFLLDGDLMRLSHRDPDLDRVMKQMRAATESRLALFFRGYAHDMGVPDPDALAATLARLTETSTRGIVMTCGSDLSTMRLSMEDLYLVITSAVAQAAPADVPSRHLPDHVLTTR